MHTPFKISTFYVVKDYLKPLESRQPQGGNYPIDYPTIPSGIPVLGPHRGPVKVFGSKKFKKQRRKGVTGFGGELPRFWTRGDKPLK